MTQTKNTEPHLDLAIGGQALIEGVMIRSPYAISIAVRKPNGSIVIKQNPFRSLAQKIRIFKLPLLRGILNLFEMLVVGMNALNFSVQESLEDDQNDAGKEITPVQKTKLRAFFDTLSFALSIVISLAFAFVLFKFLPLFLTTQLEKIFPLLTRNYLIFNTVDGLLRVGIFLLYVFLLSLFPSFRRIFEYHGAEHMAVFTYEKHHDLTPAHVKKESPRHPRCGTSFIMVVFLIAVFLFSLLPRHPDFWTNLGIRLLLIPFIASLGYEILKWSAKRQGHWLIAMLSAPGLLTQKITTRVPDEKQIEVAIAAVKGTLEFEHRLSSKHSLQPTSSEDRGESPAPSLTLP